MRREQEETRRAEAEQRKVKAEQEQEEYKIYVWYFIFILNLVYILNILAKLTMQPKVFETNNKSDANISVDFFWHMSKSPKKSIIILWRFCGHLRLLQICG